MFVMSRQRIIPQIGKFSAGNPPFLANLPGRGSNLRYIREGRLSLFFHPVRLPTPFFSPAHNTKFLTILRRRSFLRLDLPSFSSLH